MMTEAEFTQAQALLAERDNEIASLAAQERDCVEQVRIFAAGRRDAAAKRTAVELASKPIREAIAAHIAEQRRLHAEKAKAEAEERAKAEAAKPKEPSELEKLTAEVARLSALVAAKG